MEKTRRRIEKLAVVADPGWSHAQLALAFGRVAAERRSEGQAGVGRSHVSHWVVGSRPSGCAPDILVETLSRRLGRTVTADEIGPHTVGLVTDTRLVCRYADGDGRSREKHLGCRAQVGTAGTSPSSEPRHPLCRRTRWSSSQIPRRGRSLMAPYSQGKR